MLTKRLFGWLAVTTLLMTSRDVSARPAAVTAFCDVYSASPLCISAPTCSLCHTQTSSPAAWNPYGSALKDAMPADLMDAEFSSALQEALPTIELLDSDSDSFSNLEEITQGTFPGLSESKPFEVTCPDDISSLPYALCTYDRDWVFRKVHLDFCGESPSREAIDAFAKLDEAGKTAAIAGAVDACQGSEFWRGKDGVLWSMAHSTVRPVAAFKGGEGETNPQTVIGDYDNLYALWVWSMIDDHDVRDVLTANYDVKYSAGGYMQTQLMNTLCDNCCTDCPADCGTCGSSCPACCDTCVQVCNGCGEPMAIDRKAGIMTSRYYILYNVMFTAIPRAAASQAYRSFLGYNIAAEEGLFDAGNPALADEPRDYDNKGVDAAECAHCHQVLDPLTYPFSRYNGFGGKGGRAMYSPDRLEAFISESPDIINTPEAGFLLGQPVADLKEWAAVAANSDDFARHMVRRYFERLVGRPPLDGNVSEQAEFEALWRAFKDPDQCNYSVKRLMQALVKTEAYGAP